MDLRKNVPSMTPPPFGGHAQCRPGKVIIKEDGAGVRGVGVTQENIHNYIIPSSLIKRI